MGQKNKGDSGLPRRPLLIDSRSFRFSPWLFSAAAWFYPRGSLFRQAEKPLFPFTPPIEARFYPCPYLKRTAKFPPRSTSLEPLKLPQAFPCLVSRSFSPQSNSREAGSVLPSPPLLDLNRAVCTSLLNSKHRSGCP